MHKPSIFANVSFLFSKLGLSVGLLVCSTFFVGCLSPVSSDDASALAITGSIDDTGNAGVVTSAQSLETLEGCPNGGIILKLGIDENGNGELDADEVDGTKYICHGTDGDAGTKGEPGLKGDPGTVTATAILEALASDITPRTTNPLDANRLEGRTAQQIIDDAVNQAGLSFGDSGVSEDDILNAIAAAATDLKTDIDVSTREIVDARVNTASTALAVATRLNVLNNDAEFRERVSIGGPVGVDSPRLSVRASGVDLKALPGSVHISVAPDGTGTDMLVGDGTSFIRDLRIRDQLYIGDEAAPYTVLEIQDDAGAILDRISNAHPGTTPRAYFQPADVVHVENSSGNPLVTVNGRGDVTAAGHMSAASLTVGDVSIQGTLRGGGSVAVYHKALGCGGGLTATKTCQLPGARASLIPAGRGSARLTWVGFRCDGTVVGLGQQPDSGTVGAVRGSCNNTLAGYLVP
jgi:hypothetical protein